MSDISDSTATNGKKNDTVGCNYQQLQGFEGNPVALNGSCNVSSCDLSETGGRPQIGNHAASLLSKQPGDIERPLRFVHIPKEDERLKEESLAAVRIVQGILNHDLSAESELVERYSRGLRFFLIRNSGDKERARDLLQETLLIAIRKLREGPLDRPERLAGYLRGIANNVARGGRRKRIKEPLPIDARAIAAIPAEDLRPSQKISSTQTRAAVRGLLESMRVERDREILRRYYIYDQDKPEICNALGLDRPHFSRVLHRAKMRFRKIMESSCVYSDLAEQSGDSG